MSERYEEIKIDDKSTNYAVSNKGNVKNTNTNKVLKLNQKMGYLYAPIKVNGKSPSLRVHRLVALAFIPNDDTSKKFVNHIDGNKLNNCVENLEWITPKANVQHALDNKLLKPFERKVCKCDEDGNILETYDSIKAARDKTGIDDGCITKVCKEQRQHAGGFRWKYFEAQENENIDDLDIPSMKSVDGFPNYLIAKEGKVYSKSHKKYLKATTNKDGYQMVYLQENSKQTEFSIHRLVAISFIPNPENKGYVNHKNGNKLDNHVNNLEWTTNSENIKHYHRELKDKNIKNIKKVKENETI